MNKQPHRVQYYTKATDDFVTTKDQAAKLPADFDWQLTSRRKRAIGTGIYRTLRAYSYVYRRLFLHAKVVNEMRLQEHLDRGIFIYANHTQPFGDAVVPMGLARPRRVWALAEAANLSVPVLGRWIPYGGGIMTPSNMHQMRPFTAAIEQHIKAGDAIMVYPEEHVWPYATMIRPFAAGAFHYPVVLNAASYTITTTYQAGRHAKPDVTYYIDGPFWPDPHLPRKAAQEALASAVHAQMTKRSQASTYEYVQYRKRG